MERVARIELANNPWQGFRLPLHHTRIKLFNKYFVKLYNFLNLNINPFANNINGCEYLQQSHIDKQAQKNVNTKDLNPELIDLLSNFGIGVYFAESFYKSKNAQHKIHLDVRPGDAVKINWVYKGQHSSMNWYNLKPDKNLLQLTSTINTPFYYANASDVDLIDSCSISPQHPCIVQVGVLHDITNPVEDRYCLSLSLVHKGTKNKIQFDQALILLKDLLI
jgi:hypothetical protein